MSVLQTGTAEASSRISWKPWSTPSVEWAAPSNQSRIKRTLLRHWISAAAAASKLEFKIRHGTALINGSLKKAPMQSKGAGRSVKASIYYCSPACWSYLNQPFMVGQSSSTEPMDITLEICTALKACHCNEETPWPPNFTKIHHLHIIFQLTSQKKRCIYRPSW